jgi:hypothetical protein
LQPPIECWDIPSARVETVIFPNGGFINIAKQSRTLRTWKSFKSVPIYKALCEFLHFYSLVFPPEAPNTPSIGTQSAAAAPGFIPPGHIRSSKFGLVMIYHKLVIRPIYRHSYYTVKIWNSSPMSTPYYNKNAKKKTA